MARNAGRDPVARNGPTDAGPRPVTVGDVTFDSARRFVLVSGPCQIESRDHSLRIAERLLRDASSLAVPFVFKASFDKANRTSIKGMRGVGRDEGLRVLGDVREALGCPVLTDFHEPGDAAAVAQAADILQVPAFLSRQTDMLQAAGRTGAAVNVKKGQFLTPWDMASVAEKIAATGNERIILCERGTSFGYNTLVNDFRGLSIMASGGRPVMFDATHSTQSPGGRGHESGGDRSFAPLLARAAVAVGVSAVFAEAHDDPDNAPSDGAVMLRIDSVLPMLRELVAIDRVVKGL